ncbi:SPX domain-containing protein 4-like [Olea europaea var. sylvestris]|uniref:SPX domain-containing protein 4-like n=1 Tax=Olea europaea var. sylvestris TaxID=158386 RepID=UPI000C1D3940|nr:SPX domain-containing protein 4-like [Olea europaea var. sylvestris]
MKFGKEFRMYLEETLPEWRDKYLCYNLLKKLLKIIPAGDDPAPIVSLQTLQDWFVRILIDELKKFNDFYVDTEEDIIIRFQALKERIDLVKERDGEDGVFTSETEFSEEMMEIRKEFVAIHGEMVLLKTYCSLNLAGLIKILKKYDKRTGRLLCLPFIQLALRQPFYAFEPLTRLVIECEANIELLFPLEAEVIESAAVQQDKTGADPANDISNISQETAPSLEEEAVGISRSINAALRAIEGLRKPSSTNNHLSFSSLYGSLDNDGTSVVTVGNSPCEPSDTLDNEEGANEDVANSPK